jgi:hypothetical protein
MQRIIGNSMRTGRRSLIVFHLMTVLLVSGCRLSPNDEYIQGVWTFANEFNDPMATGVHLLQEAQFGGGKFYFYREVWAGFPESVEARYRILVNDGDKMTLELFDVSAARSVLDDGAQILLILERETDELRINRVLYYRSTGP